GKNRTLDELHPASPVAAVFEDLRAGDIRWHQVGRKLDSLELQVKHLRQRSDQQCLGQPRSARDQAMSTSEETAQELLDDLFLPDDDFRKLIANARARIAELFDGLPFGFVGVGFWRHF